MAPHFNSVFRSTLLPILIVCASPSFARPYVSFGTDDTGALRSALTKTVLDFFSPDTLASLDGVGVSSGSGLGINTDSTTQYALSQSQKISLGYVQNLSVKNTLTAQLQASVFIAKTAYAFPDGIDIFTDPARLRFRSVGLETALSIAKPWAIQPFVVTPFAKLGAQATHVTTTIQSALLDVRNTHAFATGFIGIGVDLQTGASKHQHTRLRIETRAYTKNHKTIAVRFVHEF